MVVGAAQVSAKLDLSSARAGVEEDVFSRVTSISLKRTWDEMSADQVAHFFLLRLEIAGGAGLWRDLGGDALGDGDADGFECFDFFGVVGDEANGGEAEHLENRGRKLVFAAVSAVAKFEVGFDRIEALILQFVGLKFGHETDAAAFLIFVEQDSGACIGDCRKGKFELLAAIASERVEDVASEALRVDAYDRWLRSGPGGNDVAHDERDGRLDSAGWRGDCVVAGLRTRDDTFEAEDAELSPACGEVCVGELANGFEGHGPIIRFGYTGFDVWGESSMKCAATTGSDREEIRRFFDAIRMTD